MIHRRFAHGAQVLLLALPLALALAGCTASLPAVPAPERVSSSEMRPEVFFDGPTRGVGQLSVAFGGRPDSIHVASTGRMQAGGDIFRLDQTIRQEGRVRRRTWQMRRLDRARYTATLTDAHGPASAVVDGPVLRLRYRATAWGAVMRQTLTLLPGDSAVDNRATVRFLGLTVARLHERIVRVP